MDILDEEIIGLWRSLHANEVKYIMVGGFATNLHGFSRTTADLDIWIEDTPQNRRSLRKALHDIGLGDLEPLETTQLIPGWTSIKMSSGFELDLMTSIKGFETPGAFEECYSLAPTAVIVDIPVKFLHLNHLIRSKELSGRPKDQIDLIELKRLKGPEEL